MTERHYVAEDCCILYGVQCNLLHGILFHAYCTLLYCYLVATYMYACVGIHLCDNIACVVMMQLYQTAPCNLLLTNLHAVGESCIPVWLIIKHSRHYNYMASSQYNYVWQNEP